MSHKTVLSNFITALYESDLDLPSKSDVEEVAESFLSGIPKKTRHTTNPGDAFNQTLCRCRVWNKGYGKQCSAAVKEDGLCKSHTTKITEFGGWAFGFYDEEAPSTHLFDYNKIKAGTSLSWKEGSKAPKKVLTEEVIQLKREYKETLGKDPKGPKANDPEWLRSKIDEFDPEDPEPKKSSGRKLSKEVIALKEEYLQVVGKKAGGPKANDPEWLKAKIQDAKIESSSSEDEQLDEDNGNITEESDDESVASTLSLPSDCDVAELDERIQEEAATKIQTAVRKYFKQCQAATETFAIWEKTHAATVIQAFTRGMVQRRAYELETKKMYQEEQEKMDDFARRYHKTTPDGEEFVFEKITYWRRKVSKQHRVFNEDNHEVGRWSKTKNRILFNEDEDWNKRHKNKVRELEQWNEEEQ